MDLEWLYSVHHHHKNFSQQPDIQLSSNFHSRLTWPRLNDFRTKILFWIVTKSSLTLVILIVISHWNLQTTNLVESWKFLWNETIILSKYDIFKICHRPLKEEYFIICLLSEHLFQKWEIFSKVSWNSGNESSWFQVQG